MAGLDIGAGIGGDHAPEQRPLQPGGEAAALQHGAEVVALAAPGVEQGGGGVAGSLGVGGVLGADGGGPLVQMLPLQARPGAGAGVYVPRQFRCQTCIGAVYADVDKLQFSTAASTSSLMPSVPLRGAMTLRSTMLRERMAAVLPEMPWMAKSSWAVRQWRLRHWDEMRGADGAARRSCAWRGRSRRG